MAAPPTNEVVAKPAAPMAKAPPKPDAVVKNSRRCGCNKASFFVMIRYPRMNQSESCLVAPISAGIARQRVHFCTDPTEAQPPRSVLSSASTMAEWPSGSTLGKCLAIRP